MKKSKQVMVGVGMSPELAKALKKEAARRECPQTVIVRAALQKYLLTAEEAAK